RDPVRLTLAGRRVLFAHGDGLGPGDRGYRALKSVLRSRAFRLLYRWLHPDLGARVARRASSTAERAAAGPAEQRRARVLRAWARETLGADPTIDLLVLGHTHIPWLEEVGPDRHYLNCGDWVHHRTFGVLETGSPPLLLQWHPSGAHRPWRGAPGAPHAQRKSAPG
ncbi:MAG: hypothetical protein RQ751_06500, partial [Longimicrobiales bacterium]|nr:hypothetical protein [Longimicrobiales bacterium]